MHVDDDPLIRLAGAIADGVSVGIDWAGAESSAATHEVQRAIQELRIVSDLAAFHRSATEQAAPNALRLAVASPRSRWGPLELRREIGKGSFGTVYLAWDPALEREVALKLLRD